MKKWVCLLLTAGCLAACTRYQPPEEITTEAKPETVEQIPEMTPETTAAELTKDLQPPAALATKEPVKVKGIYISAFAAGTDSMLEGLLEEIDNSQINTVVIDVKDDEGHVTFQMDSEQVQEIDSCISYIADIEGLIQQLKARDLYVIGRVVAFRDPYLAEQKPEWSLKLPDGSVYRDNKGMAWINPYKHEVWDYLVEIGRQAGAVGFDEIQFDYIRFSTEKGINQVVFPPEDTLGRSKTDVITEFTDYAYQELEPDVFVSADVFGTIIGSEVDAEAVGQIYHQMALNLDYISPMIYPSHYADGNFGLDHPDLQPYETILAALEKSQEDLMQSSGQPAIVRPWLQDFTASYLINYQKYGPEQVKQQIQAVYDAGYDEWILWNASCKYSWDGLREEDNE